MYTYTQIFWSKFIPCRFMLSCTCMMGMNSMATRPYTWHHGHMWGEWLIVAHSASPYRQLTHALTRTLSCTLFEYFCYYRNSHKIYMYIWLLSMYCMCRHFHGILTINIYVHITFRVISYSIFLYHPRFLRLYDI